MVRTPCCEKMGLKKGPWTPEEDQILVSYVQHYGHENWRALPRQAGLLRCGKSCRLRWINYLRPDIKRGNFTKEEEEAIINLHQHLGNRWSTIAAKLPGRTDNEIKNFWHTHLKKKLLRISPNNNNNNNNIGLLVSNYEFPINPMNVITTTNNTSTTVPLQTLAISHAKHQDQHEDAKWKLITKFDHHVTNNNNNNNEKRDSNYNNDKFDEEMEFWYNLFVKSSGDQQQPQPSTTLLVDGGDHSGCG